MIDGEVLYEVLRDHCGHHVMITSHKGNYYLECEDCEVIIIDTTFDDDRKEN